MASDKSLAAEIEAVMRKHVVCKFVGGWPLMFGIPEAAAEIAALQGRAFGDGARWMREVAAQRVGWSFRGDAPTDAERCTLNEAARCVRLLPLQPEGERNV